MSHLSPAFVFGLLVFPLLGAWSDDWGSIKRAAAEVRTLEADFVQTKNLEILTKPLVSKGSFAFRRPGDLRWEYQSPLRSVLVSTSAGVKRYVMKDGKWVPDASAKVEAVGAVLAEMNLWLRGEFEQSKAFSATLEPGPPVRVKLTPKDAAMKKYIARVVLELGAAPGVIDAVVIEEGPKASTRIEFANAKRNQSIPDDRFNPVK
ncbi:MAG: outer membrane lipoprotein carrier protein LolA [Polyangiaceae bacterium]|nr:outer membrane lipoprotein carrier protein LolA [Polyangiaceae bacterium]